MSIHKRSFNRPVNAATQRSPGAPLLLPKSPGIRPPCPCHAAESRRPSAHSRAPPAASTRPRLNPLRMRPNHQRSHPPLHLRQHPQPALAGQVAGRERQQRGEERASTCGISSALASARRTVAKATAATRSRRPSPLTSQAATANGSGGTAGRAVACHRPPPRLSRIVRSPPAKSATTRSGRPSPSRSAERSHS
jgi:hypothetical protein